MCSGDAHGRSLRCGLCPPPASGPWIPSEPRPGGQSAAGSVAIPDCRHRTTVDRPRPTIGKPADYRAQSGRRVPGLQRAVAVASGRSVVRGGADLDAQSGSQAGDELSRSARHRPDWSERLVTSRCATTRSRACRPVSRRRHRNGWLPWLCPDVLPRPPVLRPAVSCRSLPRR